MTDKEQIIITGVDVSECEFFDGSHLCKCDETIIDEHKKLKNIFSVKYVNCRDNYNCYFKQLARKTQECEELKERLERTEEDLKYQCVDCMNVKSGRYRKALDEIEYYCNKQISLTGDLPFRTTESDILDIINKVKK